MPKTSSAALGAAGKGKQVSPLAAGLIVLAFVAVCVLVGFRWMNRPEVSTSLIISTARYWVEKPVRDKLQAEGRSKSDIDRQIEEMWNKGELKLPKGEPGVDWAATPNGIVNIPKGPGEGAK